MNFYLWAMRSASVILFVIAAATVVASLAMAFALAGPFGPVSEYQHVNVLNTLATTVLSLQNAVWPLFGAALLWRIDNWLAIKQEPSE